MDKKKELSDDFVYTLALIKDEYVKATKAIAKAKTMLRTAKLRKNAIARSLNELGYDIELIETKEPE